MQTHIRLHHFGVCVVLSELRTEFWIVRGRQTIKRVLHKCIPCKISNNPQGQQIEAPLPADRVRPSRPFTVTGVDFAGPFYIRVRRETQKAYIALFICATTRAVHLELCTDMTTSKFLMALKRFIGRRGLPHTVYSDNAKTFQAANQELADVRTLRCPVVRPTSFLPNMVWLGSLLPHVRLGGEAGGSGWWALQNVASAKYSGNRASRRSNSVPR